MCPKILTFKVEQLFTNLSSIQGLLLWSFVIKHYYANSRAISLLREERNTFLVVFVTINFQARKRSEVVPDLVALLIWTGKEDYDRS